MEIDLQVLKVKGCLYLYVNVSVSPICEEYIGIGTVQGKNSIMYTCCQETIFIDYITKCSLEGLPYYVLDCEHMKVCDL